MKAEAQSNWICKTALGVFAALLTADAFSGRPEPFALGGTVSVGEDVAVYSRTSESEEGCRFSLTWEFPEWEKDTYVFVPSCIYNGNRDFTCQDRKDLSGFCYPPKFELSDLVRTDVRLVTDIPKLNEDGSGLIEITTGDMATPCVGLYFPKARRGVLIFTAQQVLGRNIGYSIESGRVRVDCPANRKSVYAFCAPHLENVDRPLALKAGDRVELPYVVMDFSADGITGFFETFFRNRNRLLPRSRIRAPYSKELIAAVENGINRDSWQESGYWAEGRTGRWTVGWVGGMPTAWGMLAGGLEPVSHERAMRVPDFLAANQTPFGTYIERWADGRHGHHAGDNRVNGETDCDYQLVRRSAEGLFYLLRFADRIKLKAQWLSSARLAADGFVRAWREYGDWGMYADVSSGRPLVGGTANAALACAALVRAYRVFGEPAYLDVACEAGTSYYERFVAKGLSYGGPNDALMAPDSESAAALLESLVTLAEEKHSEEWIRRAKDAAHLLSSWVVSYPYVFPEDSEFGRLAINTTGAVFANAQNKHAAPGLCTCSGDALYRLYKLTGDRAYLELCRDIAAFIPQTVSTSVRPIHDREKGCPMPEGWINERVNMSDWEGAKFVGGVFYGTCWCTTAFMCTCADLLPIKELDLIDATDEPRTPIRLNVSAGDPLGLVRDRIRSLSDKEKIRGVEVVLAPGEYCLPEGLSLTARDGGCSPTASVVWRAEKPGSVRVLGGRRVPSSRFHPVVEKEVRDCLPGDAIARVRVAEVEDLLPGELAAWPDSFAGVSPPPVVFAFGKPSRPARWPNEDWCEFDKPVDRGKLVQGDPGIGVYRNGAFVFSDERPRRWNFSKGVWLNGYWTHDWYNRTVRAGSWGSEDGTNDVLRLAGDVQYGVMGGTWGREKRRFRACNLLEELDDPGEHWLDRKRKLLYVMPPNGEVSPEDEIVLAVSDQDLVHGEGVCNLRLEGISFECNYGMLVRFEGVTNILVADCRFVNTARSGVSVAGVSNSVVRCEAFNCGESGVGLHGGDRRRLLRSDSLVEDCHIHDFGLFKRTYAPGISVSGIGHTVRGNEIDHAPHQAVGYHGNDILFEFNDVHHVLMETGDSGAFYTGRDWTTAGNVLRYNFVHEIGSPGCDVNVMGFYFDDCDCGDEVYGNVFWKVPRGILIGGGREHPVRNNIFAECEIGVSIDDRGLTWEKWNTPVDGWDLEAKALRIGYDKEPWQSRYPRLARIMSDSPREPLYNPIEENVFVDCPGRYVWLEGPQMSKVLPKLTVTNNVAYASVRQVRKTVKDDRIATGFDIRSGEAEPGFENARGGDFRLRAGADVVRVLPGVGSLPLARICRNTLSRVHKTQNKKGRKHE